MRSIARSSGRGIRICKYNSTNTEGGSERRSQTPDCSNVIKDTKKSKFASRVRQNTPSNEGSNNHSSNSRRSSIVSISSYKKSLAEQLMLRRRSSIIYGPLEVDEKNMDLQINVFQYLYLGILARAIKRCIY